MARDKSADAESSSTDDVTLSDDLFQLSFVLQAFLAQVASDHDLSPIQARMLGVLRDREPLMQELARHLHLEKSSLTGLVDRAEARGLVERVSSPDDGRAVRVRLTALGHKLVRAASKQLAREVAVLTERLNEPERKRLSTLVGRVLRDDAQRHGLL